MNRERLEHWIKVLENVRDAEKAWDIDKWFEDFTDPYACGTSACALGWAARDKQFIKEGLTVNMDRAPGNIFYVGVSGAQACEEFFSIDGDAAAHIVYPSNYLDDDGDELVPCEVTVDMAISHIRDVLDGRI